LPGRWTLGDGKMRIRKRFHKQGSILRFQSNIIRKHWVFSSCPRGLKLTLCEFIKLDMTIEMYCG